MRARRQLASVALGVAVMTSCEFGRHPVAPTADRPVVHAVLNPFASTYVVLVEETLTGRVDINSELPFQESDPIATGSGVPIGNARVVISDDFGDSASASEELLADRSTGVYRFFNSSGTGSPSELPLVPGGRYHLTVSTPSGAVVTGTTIIPDGVASTPLPLVQFDKDHDTLRLSWPRTPGAKTYLTRINTPRGPYHIFTDSLSIRLPGTLRDFFGERLPSVFVPGFTQAVLVSAVDSNFYDYYRSQNNPFTGTGLINHLQGGTGLFGALVPLRSATLQTFAAQDQPVEGEYDGTPSFASAAPNHMSLYIESQSHGLATITGNYTREALPGERGVIGFLNGRTISLAFLREDLASDTSATYSGTVYAPDSIVGTMRATGERIVYRKVPPVVATSTPFRAAP